MAGTGLYWGRAETALRELIAELRVPVFLNGQARGCVPADDELAFSRARGTALKGADVALVVGVPMDFRLGFGGAFGEDTKIVVIDSARPNRTPPRAPTSTLYGGIAATLRALGGGGALDSGAWVRELREVETERSEGERADFGDDRAPLHPMRLYHDLQQVIDRDAIIIGDGGDFVSFAGRVIDSYEPGCWLDPGPFGCLGSGPGYALAAKLARPDKQVVLLFGDGAFGFSGMEFDTLARHGVQRRRRHGQQRHLGAREAPDGVPLRLLGRGRAAARDAATTRSSRRSAATASSSARPAISSRRWTGRSPRAFRRS